MDLNKYKIKYLSEKTQFVVFELNGKIIDSCNTILNFDYTNKTIYEIFPILDSIQSSLESLKIGDAEIVYPVVEHTIDGKECIFDFIFSKIELEGKEMVLWIIHDNTEIYFSIMQLKRRINKEMLSKDQPSLRIIK